MKENIKIIESKLTAVLIVMVCDRISTFDCFPILMIVFQFIGQSNFAKELIKLF